MPSTDIYLALGSNLGDRAGYLKRALDALCSADDITLTDVSPTYETSPESGHGAQPDYLNLVARIRTSVEPIGLLVLVQRIECDLGRRREVPGGSRTMDIDILLYGRLVRPEPDPVIPHVRMHRRAFVLRPLSDIAPDLVHPVLGKSVRQLLHDLPGSSFPPVRRLAAPTFVGHP